MGREQFGSDFFTSGFRPVFCGSFDTFSPVAFVQFSKVRLILFHQWFSSSSKREGLPGKSLARYARARDVD